MGILQQLFSVCTQPVIKDQQQEYVEPSPSLASQVQEQRARGQEKNLKGDHCLCNQQAATVQHSATSANALDTVSANNSDSNPEPAAELYPCDSGAVNEVLGTGSVEAVSPQQLIKDVSNCRWIGQGSQGVVYEGIWQGASVAVKWSLTNQAVDVNAFELVVSRMLGHPNVVQTFNAKVAILDEKVFEPVAQPQEDGGPFHTSSTVPDCMSDIQRLSTRTLSHQTLSRLDSFQSDEGFGSPFGRPSNIQDVRDLLKVMDARPYQFITQMIMECCDQGSLMAAIAKGIFLPTNKFGPKVALRALLRTAREVAQGILHMHEAQVVHGDLKPANVLLMNSRKDRRGFIAKVSDFGLSQICAASHTIEDAPWGTLVFQAPERFYSNALSPASDVWSFGVLVWQMYTAKMPYEGVSQSEMIAGVTANTLHLTWPPGSPASLVAIVEDCMQYTPPHRPTFAELVKTLAAAESDVRLEGHRLSNSMDGLTLQLPGRFSHGASERHSAHDSRSGRSSASSAMTDTTVVRQLPGKTPHRSSTDLQPNITKNRHVVNTNPGLRSLHSMNLHNYNKHAGSAGCSAPVSPKVAGKVMLREGTRTRSVLASRRMQYAVGGSQASGIGSMPSCRSSMDWQSNSSHAGQKSGCSSQTTPDACFGTVASPGEIQIDLDMQRPVSSSTTVSAANEVRAETVETSWAHGRVSKDGNNSNKNNSCRIQSNSQVVMPINTMKSTDMHSAVNTTSPSPWSVKVATANINPRPLPNQAPTRIPGLPAAQQSATVAQLPLQGVTTSTQHPRPATMSRLRHSSGEFSAA